MKKINSFIILFFIAVITVGCGNKDILTRSKSETDTNIVYSKMIIVLKFGISHESFIKRCKIPKVKLIKTIGAKKNILVISYKVRKRNPNKILEKVRKMEFVKSAEFEKKVQSRN